MTFRNNSPTTIKGKGSLVSKKKFKVDNVLFFDGIIHNLLSVSQMCDEGHEVIFGSKNCVLTIFLYM